MDTLLDKLRAGDSVGGRKNRRNRNAATRQSISAAPRIVPQLTGNGTGDAADIAKDMLAALKNNGFNAATPGSVTLSIPSLSTSAPATKPRRSRLRGSLKGDLADSGRSSVDVTLPREAIPEGNEDEDLTIKVSTPRLDSPSSSRGDYPSSGLVSSDGDAMSDAKELPQLPR